MKALRPHQKTKKEMRRRKRKIIFLTIFGMIAVVFFVWFMNQERFKITKIEINGNKTILMEDIQEKIDENLRQKILWILPKDNVIFTNTQAIQDIIENSFPKIYHAKVKIANGSELIIDVEEREPHSLWCKNQDYELAFDEECYFADQRGYIYTKAPYFSGGVFEKIYTTEGKLQIGEQVMDKNDFNEFFSFSGSLNENYGMKVDKIFIGDFHEVKIYISSFLKKSFTFKPYIIYKDTEEYNVIGRNIGLMKNHELFQKEFKKNPTYLKFIDLRIKDQIRFKFYSDDEWFSLIENNKNEKNETTNE